mgnify:CR=1 FL=1
MFFIKAGSVIAWLAVVFGGIRLALGLFVAIQFSGEENAFFARRYLAAPNSGESINEAAMMFLAGILIGLLVQIAKKRNDS